ncbi:MAG: tripartite tricarboxylate transporter permease [Candidatus Poribacteria bacterium]|jgi:putative tricarboxylic transport membrane protein|nr:tripartite tricarboxylate transporter permease [Candidatus Poribacteria bacterium]MDP6748421.1 tripartite tricarboxylate transporter permease [Candidatus Poribacteria bacterium]MDP6962347.1 tripartite tricarboxylate transporter permease [Dehalococcoidia bacterium]
MLEGILTGFSTAFTLTNICMVFVGVVAGTLIGMLPGLGPISAIALMIPITYGFDSASGLILMAGVYYGAVFGGSTSSILINAPGVAGTVATAFDGHPLARKGQAGKALAVAAYSSFAGGTIGAVFLLLGAPVLAGVSVSFQSADYFSLMLMGLAAVSAFAPKGQFLKAVVITVVGLMLATVGTDNVSGIQRFTFGQLNLVDGISFLLLAMATFALSEALMMVLEGEDTHLSSPATSNLRQLRVSKQELKEIVPTIGRSSVLGFLTGILPGAGATIASFLAYGMEQAIDSSKSDVQFGEGNLKGLAAPETANNAASTGSFVPLLTLGIPGSGTTAVVLGALISYGVQPGPQLYTENPQVFWSVIISMYLGNVVLLILNLPLIPYIAKLITLPKRFLIPFILFFSLIGVYLVSFNTFDIYLMVGFAIVAILLRFLEFPMAPMLLGFVLGGLLEDNLRRALLISGGQLDFLWQRPITLGILIVTVVILLLPLYRRINAFPTTRED